MNNNLTNKTYRAAGYLRLSVEDEDKEESSSIKNQRDFIMEYALKQDIEIYDYYIDDGYSGGNFDRPGFKRLINDIENGLINCIIVKDMSRLGRDFIETGNYIYRYFPEHNIRFIALLDGLDTLKSNTDDDMIPFRAVINDMYLKDISRKIKSVRHDKMRKGEFVSSTVPYGYKRDENNNKKLVIDEYSANIVKRIFNLKDNGTTNLMIARELSNDGILPPDLYNGKKLKQNTITTNLWKPCTVRRILSNEIYIGTLIQGKYCRVSLKSKKKKLLPKEQWEIVENAVPSIIDKEQFSRVNKPVRRNYIRFSKYDYLLKGLVVCNECGKSMLVRRVKNQADPTKITPVYVCRTYANYRNNVCSMHYCKEDILNDYVLTKVKELLKKYSDKILLGNKYENIISTSSTITDYQNSLIAIKNKIVNIDKAFSDLYKDKVNGILTEEEFLNIKKELANDKETSKAKQEEIELSLKKAKTMFADENSKKKFIEQFLNSDTPSKELLNMLIKEIKVREDKKIEIDFNFSINGVTCV